MRDINDYISSCLKHILLKDDRFDFADIKVNACPMN